MKKFLLSLVVIIAAIFLNGRIQAASAITNAQASLLSAQQSNSAYIASQQTSDWMIAAVWIVTLLVLIGIWRKELVKFFTSGGSAVLLVLVLSFLMTACGGNARKFVTQTNEVTFVVQMNGDANQAVVGDVPTNGDAKFWEGKVKDLTEITINTYCFQANPTASCENRDVIRIITVDTSSKSYEWTAPPVIRGQPFPDMTNAFSMQSYEASIGGSTGVYVGAQVRAHIDRKNAALYLATYGYTAMDTARQSYPALSLESVIKADMRIFIQTELNREYGNRSVSEQNRDMVEMFDITKTNLITTFESKGITIDSFGYNGGNVYENPAIQEAVDSSFERARLLQEAKDAAGRQAILDQQNMNTANVQATITVLEAQSDAKAMEIKGAAIAQNPLVLQQQMIDQWNGNGPSTVIGSGNGTVPLTYAIPMPEATPSQ